MRIKREPHNISDKNKINNAPSPTIVKLLGSDLRDWLSLAIQLTSRFEATRALFWGRPLNFEPWSDNEDVTRAGIPSPNFCTTPAGRRLIYYV
ncbi:hypothetical protein AVEN_55267-1 [Araneus ventricosus]|uniref:Uncharacterized protein n=1 Tax=Araneus ventricosus TaxID=182803 RepID=A0A4Y2D6W3_ARAVE|nr:hypothetical protein AVEN_55267-1 [Araneus ventricosus]